MTVAYRRRPASSVSQLRVSLLHPRLYRRRLEIQKQIGRQLDIVTTTIQMQDVVLSLRFKDERGAHHESW